MVVEDCGEGEDDRARSLPGLFERRRECSCEIVSQNSRGDEAGLLDESCVIVGETADIRGSLAELVWLPHHHTVATHETPQQEKRGLQVLCKRIIETDARTHTRGGVRRPRWRR